MFLIAATLCCVYRKRLGEDLPSNEGEMGVMQENDPRIQSMIRDV